MKNIIRNILFGCLSLTMPGSAMWAQNADHTELLAIQALVYAENAVAGFKGEYSFQIVRPPTLPATLRPGRITLEAERMSKQEPVGRFFVVFRISVDGRPVATTRVEMDGSWSGSLYQAKSALQRKTVITESDLEMIDFEGVPPPGALKELPNEIRLRQPLPLGKIITQMDVEAIPLINATDKVRVTLQNGPLQITSDAIARSSGARGERVRLEMEGSRKMVQAIVTGPGEAVLEVRSTRVAL
jgi:flagella basal body P-ring formation protein FlgA